MDKIFISLLDEASFTNEILRAGVTQIRKANYACKGKYFEAFSNLSIGLERISKLCILIDYRLNNGEYPSINYVAKELRHDLVKLYTLSQTIIKNRSFQLDYFNNLDTPIHQNILKVLSDFAKGDRYANIDFIIDNNSEKDPICNWSNNVDKWMYDNLVSEKKKQIIERNAKAVEIIGRSFMLVRHIDEQKQILTSVYESSLLTGKTEAIYGYRQLYVLQIIRYWVDLLRELQYEAYNKFEIPYFSELFAIFNNDDSYLKTRKDFTSNR